MRTHTCGELNKEHKDQEVVLCGWVHRRRDFGKLVFIDVRDRYGLTQVVFVPSVSPAAHAEAQKLGPEFVIKIKGAVNLRSEKNINPDLATDGVELLAKELEILNTAKVPVFEIEDRVEAGEDVRLTYRYLDIRRSKVRESLLLRHKLIAGIRSFLNTQNFVEVETPILTKSTPEGARDFLVPSRLTPGAFYALPQSPQLFKQILMVSGMDRYYQVVKCFRDEDLRADRQPEFTQLDMELSFVDQDVIFDLTERMYQQVFKDVLNIDLPIPFPRMTHAEAMAKYNSDKPDIRQDKSNAKEFAFLWVVDFPLMKYNSEEKRWDSEHHPFTGINPEDLPLLESGQYDKVRGRCYDLVLNGNEIGSGSVRIHRRELQQKIFDIIGLAPEETLKRFGFLLRAFEYGAPPHAGVAYGIDRIVTIITGNESIRDCIAFPKTQKGTCLMTEAPSEVDDKQLKELGILTISAKG
ncbi:MAG: aspartate--tRNA ligase [Candidatus Omnitrophica bacterium]|nr:aspartate--tRNA ligase [Candidatus Omnitrophota bacterium]